MKRITDISERRKLFLPDYFAGNAYRNATNWKGCIDEMNQRPIQYLEIGVLHGANVLSVNELYAKHKDSVMTCIDPWEEYDDYTEFKDANQNDHYTTFQINTEHIAHKLKVIRGYSHQIVPSLPDDSFDLIYIDGNHQPEYVCEDAVLCFRKLKSGGFMIFDDYGFGGPDLTERGINGFALAYRDKINLLGLKESQLFIQKK